MLDMIEEFLVVLAYSKRTQVALLLGAISFIVILMCGAYFVGGFQLHGMLAPLTDQIREVLLGRYEKVAWGALGAFLLLAIQSYLKDRKKLLREALNKCP